MQAQGIVVAGNITDYAIERRVHGGCFVSSALEEQGTALEERRVMHSEAAQRDAFRGPRCFVADGDSDGALSTGLSMPKQIGLL